MVSSHSSDGSSAGPSKEHYCTVCKKEMLAPNFMRSLAKVFIYIGCIMGSLPFIGLFIGEELPVMVPFIALGGLMVICGFLWWWYYRKYLKWKKWAVEEGWQESRS